MISILLYTIAFFTPSVKLVSGRTVNVYGKGSPIVFSTGLFGIMSHRIYSDFINHLQKNLSVCILNDISPITTDIVEECADALAVDKIAFLSHSSLDLSILGSSRIEKAIMLDPITFPSFDTSLQPSPPVVDTDCNSLVIYAGQTYVSAPAVPKVFLSLIHI